MPKSFTVWKDNPSSVANSVSEMWTLPTELIPSDMVCSTGRMTKLMLPTLAKLGAFRVCKAVKLSNSNVPVMVRNPDAVKAVTEEVRLTETSPCTFCTPCGIVTVLMATAVTMMFPVTVEQLPRASRSA